MCNNTCNCAANFERLNGEIESMKTLLISINAMVDQQLIKKEDLLDETRHVNNLEEQRVESSMKLDIPVITPPNVRKFVDDTFETMSSKQPSYSPIMDLPSQEFDCFERKTRKRNDDSGDNDEVFPITGMELPKTLDNLCFTKSYFRNGLVTVRDCPITIHSTTIQSHKILKSFGVRYLFTHLIKPLTNLSPP